MNGNRRCRRSWSDKSLHHRQRCGRIALLAASEPSLCRHCRGPIARAGVQIRGWYRQSLIQKLWLEVAALAESITSMRPPTSASIATLRDLVDGGSAPTTRPMTTTPSGPRCTLVSSSRHIGVRAAIPTACTVATAPPLRRLRRMINTLDQPPRCRKPREPSRQVAQVQRLLPLQTLHGWQTCLGKGRTCRETATAVTVAAAAAAAAAAAYRPMQQQQQ